LRAVTSPAAREHCAVCGERLHARRPQGLSRALAWNTTAALLLLPAYLLPVLHQTYYGEDSPTTILGGVRQLWQEGFFGVAALVFAASFCVPLLKIGCLYALCLRVVRPRAESARALTRLYRVLRVIGRWSMLDIFVVAILAGVVHFGAVADMRPGEGAAYFCASVVATLVGTLSFDPRLLWDALRAPAPGTVPPGRPPP
jgi:paraquat-inducible protein A